MIVDTGTVTAKVTYGALVGGVTSDIQEDVAQLQEDVGTLQTDVGTLQTDVDTAEGNIATLQTNVGTLQTGLSTAQADIAKAVRFDEQTLIYAQQAQARANIDASDTATANAGLYAAEAVAMAYDGAVILPCDDQKLSATAYTALPADKHGMLININGVSVSSGPRLRIYGMGDDTTGMVVTSAPTYAKVPGWYFTPCTAFVVGHTYAFDVVVVSGSVDRNNIELNWYIDLRNNTENKTYSSFYVGTTWECTFLPEMVCFGARQYIYDNAVLWLKITDITAAVTASSLATEIAALKARIEALEEDSLGKPSVNMGWMRPIANYFDTGSSSGLSVEWVDASDDAPVRPTPLSSTQAQPDTTDDPTEGDNA